MNANSKQTVISHLLIADIAVELVCKPIKNVYIGVYPPNGNVRVTAPLFISHEAVHLVVIRKLGWIRRQQEKFIALPCQLPQQLVSGESHYFVGRCYRLRVVERTSNHRVVLCAINNTLELYVRPGSDAKQREEVLSGWYREQLKVLIPPLLDKWQSVLGVRIAEWGIKKMKTRWGSCNPLARRIWLNLELIKKPISCIEYVVVHELLHLHERHHNQRFKALLSKYLPHWKQEQAMLNNSLLK